MENHFSKGQKVTY